MLVYVFLFAFFTAALAMPADLRESNGTDFKNSGGISRDTIIARAQDWVNRRVPYSQSDYTDGYRQDCSGYVSMAWASSQPGHSTYNMQEICYRIDRSQLQPGDAILNPNQHVLLFHYWVDGDNFYQYAEIDYVRNFNF
jgi:cell wall-associated NlpC family hydrolase